MKTLVFVFTVLMIVSGCSGERQSTPRPDTNPVVIAGKIIKSNNWSKSDATRGKMINETDEYWDIAFPIPDAIQGGEKPDHRIVRVFKSTNEAKELGTD